MSNDIHLKFIDNVYMKVECDLGIHKELSEFLSFYAPNYKFHPKVKARMWDGKIRLLNTMTATCYVGLSQVIKKFCDSRGYSFTFDDEFYYENCSEHELTKHIQSLNIPEKFQSRDYQFQSILKCIRSKRRTLISPTSSGKSFMIYVLSQWYKKEKCLIIVPTTALVLQFKDDIYSYGFKGKIADSVTGLSRTDYDIDADIVISTWQTLNNGKTSMPKEWYNQFGVVFGDEAHTAKATLLTNILCNLTNCQYRFGTTGTLDDDLLNKHTIIGLFGPTYRSISTKEMMDRGYSSKLKIKCIVLKYPKEDVIELKKRINDIKGDKKTIGSKKYNTEIDFIVNSEKRNKFIKNLVLSLKGNKLIFFRKIEHGEILRDMLKDISNTFHIDGNISAIKRDQIKKAIEEEDNCNLVASLGTTSTGISINRLKHMIGTAPQKAKIKLLQAIGRMLRLHEEKMVDGAIYYDIVDDLSEGSFENYSINHFRERCKIYDQEEFEYEIYNVKLK